MTPREPGESGTPPTEERFRIEKDALGEVPVPADRYWGAQTQRSADNFRIGVGRFTWGRPVIHALGVLKLCAAQANLELGQLPADKVDLIAMAAQDVIERPARRRIPPRRLPDRLRHPDEHECERGHRRPARTRLRAPVGAARSRSTRTTT